VNHAFFTALHYFHNVAEIFTLSPGCLMLKTVSPVGFPIASPGHSSTSVIMPLAQNMDSCAATIALTFEFVYLERTIVQPPRERSWLTWRP
jgi:hypothetical protein